MTTIMQQPAKDKRAVQISRGQARFAFIVLLTINILNYTDRYILSAVLPKIQVDLHLDNTQLGLLASSFLLIYAIATLPLGVWADRSTRKTIVAVCVGIWSVATTLAGFTQNFVQLFSMRSVLGIGEAGYAPAALSLIGDYFPKELRGRVLSIWSIGNLIGTALGLIIGGIVADLFGWRWAFYIVGIPGLIAALLIWRSVEPVRGIYDKSDAPAAAHGSIGKDFGVVVRKLFTIPTFWILLAAFIFSFFTIGSASTWIPTYFVRAFHLSVAQAGTLSGAVLAGGSLVGTLLGGWLADMLQRRMAEGRMLISTISFLLGAPITLVALLMHQLIPFIVMFLLAIIVLSLCLGPLNAVIQDIIAPEMRATAIGIVLLLAHLFGDASSPVLVGAIADSSSGGLGFALLITAPPCLLIAGLICLIGLRTVASDMRNMQKQLHGEKAEA